MSFTKQLARDGCNNEKCRLIQSDHPFISSPSWTNLTFRSCAGVKLSCCWLSARRAVAGWWYFLPLRRLKTILGAGRLMGGRQKDSMSEASLVMFWVLFHSRKPLKVSAFGPELQQGWQWRSQRLQQLNGGPCATSPSHKVTTGSKACTALKADCFLRKPNHSGLHWCVFNPIWQVSLISAQTFFFFF